MGTCWNCGHKTSKKDPEIASKWKTEEHLCKRCINILKKESEAITSEDDHLSSNFLKQLFSLKKLSYKEQELFLQKISTDISRLNLMFEKSTLFKEVYFRQNRLIALMMPLLDYFIKQGFDEDLLVDFYLDLYYKYNDLIQDEYDDYDRVRSDFYENLWFEPLKKLISFAVRKLRLSDASYIAFRYGVWAQDEGDSMFWEGGYFTLNLKQLENRLVSNDKLLDEYDSALRKEKQELMKAEEKIRCLEKLVEINEVMRKMSPQIIGIEPERKERVKELCDLAENINSAKIKREILSWVKSYETGNEPACEKIRPLMEMICEDIILKEGLMNPENPEWDAFIKKNHKEKSEWLEKWRIKKSNKYGPDLFLKIEMLSYHFKKPELKELEFDERGVPRVLHKYVAIGNPLVHTGSPLPIHLGNLIEDLKFILEWHLQYLSWKNRDKSK